MPKNCNIDGCERRYASKGYCGMHYARNRGGFPMGRPHLDAPLTERIPFMHQAAYQERKK